MAESPQKFIESRDTTLFLLQNLGFVINWEKSELVPCQKIDFLGFQIDTCAMMFYLPQEKVQKIKQLCLQMLNSVKVTVREVASLTGKLVSTVQAILPANLQCRYLQMLQTKSLLSGKNYESFIILTKAAKEEISWWLNQVDSSNGKTIISSTPDKVITSDASNQGWGAVCMGQRTGGIWNSQEKLLHINVKELLAAFFAINAFAKHDHS